MRAPEGPARGASVAKSFVELVDPLGHGDVAPIRLGSLFGGAVRGRFRGRYCVVRRRLDRRRLGGLGTIRRCGRGRRPLAPVLTAARATSCLLLGDARRAVLGGSLDRSPRLGYLVLATELVR